jgi:glycosyltransferase involved in cell wall biosynthesis
MYRGRKVAVVVPAYNVADTIASVINGIPDFVDLIVVVNDASTDRTAGSLRELQTARLTTLQHTLNRGVGGAMVTGFRAALDRGADLIVKIDGDGQMDPEFIPALLDPIVSDGYGYAKGNRFLFNERLREMPKLRLIGTFLLTFLLKLASGYWHVFDPVNGYVAIAADSLRKIPLDRLAKRYFFESDMLIHLNIFKVRVKDVPLPSRYGDEKSSMRLSKVVLSFPFLLLKGFWYRLYKRYVLREFSAVAVFWVFGILFLIWGTGFGSYTWLRSSWSGRPASTGTVMLSVLPFILGFELVLQAMLIEIQDSPR